MAIAPILVRCWRSSPPRALFALWRLISSIRVDQLLASILSLAPLALAAIAIASALATHRFFATRRTLRSRRAVAIVPADEFDAEPDAVLRFAAQLAASERRVAGWVDRRACSDPHPARRGCRAAARLPDRSSRAGERGAAHRAAQLRRRRGATRRGGAERGRGGGAEADDGEPAVLRTELVLARPSVEPLARLSPKPDPLQPFAAAIGRLHSGGEDASVCVDLLPASGFRAARLRRRLRREARRIHGERRDWAALLERRTSAAARGPTPRSRSSAAGRCRRSTRSCASPASCSRRRSSCAARRRLAGRQKRRCRACSPPSGRWPSATTCGPPACRSPASPSSAPISRCGGGASSAASPPASSGPPARRS